MKMDLPTACLQRDFLAVRQVSFNNEWGLKGAKEAQDEEDEGQS